MFTSTPLSLYPMHQEYKPSPPRPNGSHYCQNTRNILPLMKPLGQFGPFACPGSKITKNPICAHFRAATAVHSFFFIRTTFFEVRVQFLKKFVTFLESQFLFLRTIVLRFSELESNGSYFNEKKLEKNFPVFFLP